MRLARVAAGALVGVAVLAGCSSKEPASETLPTPSPTAAASEALPPLGPADFPMPAEAREKTPAGAEAALRYYLELVSRQAGISGQPLRDLSRDCDFCDFLADRYDQDAAAGYVVEGGQITIEDLSSPAVNGEVAELAVALSQSSVTVLDAIGQTVEGRGEAARQGISVGAAMTWSQSQRGWIMNQLVTNG
jgi:hypothetical protein